MVKEKDRVLIILPDFRIVFAWNYQTIAISSFSVHSVFGFNSVENDTKQNIEEGIEELGLDFDNYRRLDSNQISIELTTDERIRLRRQAFEDVEIDGEDVQHNGEFPSVVQRFQLDRLLAMPDDFGDIKQISLDIEFLAQPHHEYKKQLTSNDLNSVITTTQNATELTRADQFFKQVNIFQTAVSNKNFNQEENYVRIMAGIQLEKLYNFHWPHESPPNADY